MAQTDLDFQKELETPHLLFQTRARALATIFAQEARKTRHAWWRFEKVNEEFLILFENTIRDRAQREDAQAR